LTSPDLDAQLSQGRPLRLRMVARKSGAIAPPARAPLQAAIRALREYRHRHPHANGSRLVQFVPVRLRAHWMDWERRPRPSRSSSAA
jgi:hypothetical protein